MVYQLTSINKNMNGFLGEIRVWPLSYAPQNWAMCDGSLLDSRTNSDLAALLGTTYGGDGTSTFGLPNLMGRTVVGVGQGPGLENVNIGEMGGDLYQTLTSSNMPVHNHAVTLGSLSLGGQSEIEFAPKASNQNGTSTNPVGNYPAKIAGDTDQWSSLMTGQMAGYAAEKTGAVQLTGTPTLDNAGAGTPFTNLQACIGMNFIICTNGVFPSGANMTHYCGEILMSAQVTPIRVESWTACEGQQVVISDLVDLYTIIGNLYYTGNEPNILFQIPDLRGRVPIGTLESQATGQSTGTAFLGISFDHMPAHSHVAQSNLTVESTIEFSATPKVSTLAGTSNSPKGNIAAVTSSENRYTDTSNAISQMANSQLNLEGGFSITCDLISANTGANVALSSYSPYLGLNTYMQTQGNYPSRTNASSNNPNNDLVCGEIRLFAGDFAPAGWEFCRGQLLTIETYTELFGLLYIRFGGDGTTTFGLPNLGTRMPQGFGGEGGLAIGELGGTYTTSLTVENLPAHTHAVSGSISVSDTLTAEVSTNCATVQGTVSTPEDNYFAPSSGSNAFQQDQLGARSGGATSVPYNSNQLDLTGSLSVANAGGGSDFSVVMPSLQINYIICLKGIYPSNNQ
jgi:microcystin-dependent protein